MRISRGLPFNACVNARACTSLRSTCVFPTMHTTIMNSTRGWPLLGLLTLPIPGEQSKGEQKRDTSKASVYARVCMF